MPSWVNEILINVMEEIIQCHTTYESFQKKYSWLPCTCKEDWDAIQPVLSYWIDQASTPSISDEGDAEDNSSFSSSSLRTSIIRNKGKITIFMIRIGKTFHQLVKV